MKHKHHVTIDISKEEIIDIIKAHLNTRRLSAEAMKSFSIRFNMHGDPSVVCSDKNTMEFLGATVDYEEVNDNYTILRGNVG